MAYCEIWCFGRLLLILPYRAFLPFGGYVQIYGSKPIFSLRERAHHLNPAISE